MRAVTSDHILFDECIDAFKYLSTDTGQSFSYILTDFDLPAEWDLPECTVYPSVRFQLRLPYWAFICKIKNPKRVGVLNSHLYGMALSAVISFVLGRECRSPRDEFNWDGKDLDDSQYYRLALRHPVQTAGCGAVDRLMDLEKGRGEVFSFIEKILSLQDNIYYTAMQSIRLIHLSLINKREDFGLSYQLLASALEVIAQKVVSIDEVKETHPSESLWKEMAQRDPEVKSLFSEYKKLRGSSSYIKRRFVEFVRRFAGEEFFDHYNSRSQPKNEMLEAYRQAYPRLLPPAPKLELSSEQIVSLFEKIYNQRSKFVHEGKQPPHRSPHSKEALETIFSMKGKAYSPETHVGYDLLLEFARFSIKKWVHSA